jgi:hypothetical protein
MVPPVPKSQAHPRRCDSRATPICPILSHANAFSPTTDPSVRFPAWFSHSESSLHLADGGRVRDHPILIGPGLAGFSVLLAHRAAIPINLSFCMAVDFLFTNGSSNSELPLDDLSIPHFVFFVILTVPSLSRIFPCYR